MGGSAVVGEAVSGNCRHEYMHRRERLDCQIHAVRVPITLSPSTVGLDIVLYWFAAFIPFSEVLELILTLDLSQSFGPALF